MRMTKLFPSIAVPIAAAIAGLPPLLVVALVVGITLYVAVSGWLFQARALERLDLQNERYDLENERRRRLLPPPPPAS